MRFPENFKYTKDHEWASKDGGGSVITIGITDHAQSSLGDIVFVELPAVGKTLKQGQTFGVVESIKAVSDLYAPVSGAVVEINDELKNDPSLLNKHPHTSAWLLKIKIENLADWDQLLDAAEYSKLVSSIQ